MTERDRLVADVVAAAGGQVVGRVRLQKIFYLLEQVGLASGLPFEYHHFGPYSAELSGAIADAAAFGLIEEKLGHRASDGVAFSTYALGNAYPNESNNEIGNLHFEDVLDSIEKMQKCSSTVLELAATIYWLRNTEKVPDWQNELRRRKGVKAEGDRIDRAVRLLRELKLN